MPAKILESRRSALALLMPSSCAWPSPADATSIAAASKIRGKCLIAMTINPNRVGRFGINFGRGGDGLRSRGTMVAMQLYFGDTTPLAVHCDSVGSPVVNEAFGET